MRNKFKIIFVLSLMITTTNVWAKPVSFKDGYGVMSSYSGYRSDLEVNYSVSRNYAVGLSTINLLNNEDGTAKFQFFQFNTLLKRWNELDSQGNIYLSLGAGAQELKDDTSLAGLASVEADFETRLIYTSLLSESLLSADKQNFHRLRYRAGFAPYKAPFELLQTWIIAQVEYTPQLENQFMLTPVLRFFYDNIALEVGSSTEGKIFIGTMLHF